MELQTAVQSHSRGVGALSAPEPRAGRPPWRTALGSPLLIASLVCAALAAISAAVLPTVPSYDPWSWIVWGREIVDPHLSFAVGGGPSWKPLPVMFTTIFALFGGAAPTLWVIAARAGGLLGLVAGYRLARRLVGVPPYDSSRAWGMVAGLLAAAAIVLTQRWGYYMFRGTSEPLLIGTTLWAVDRHLAGRHGAAFVFGVATGLIRPEAWPFLAAYAIWLWIHEPRLRPLAVAGIASIPLFWFVPPLIGSGQPFLAAVHAHQYNGHLGSDRFAEVLRRGLDLQVAPALIGAIAAVALAVRPRAVDRLTLWLAALVIGWWVIVVAMTLAGYPGLERFYLPAAAITCALAGAGVVRVARIVGGASAPGRPQPARDQQRRFHRLRSQTMHVLLAPRTKRADHNADRAPIHVVALQGALAIALVGAAVPFTLTRVSALRAQKPLAARAVKRLDQLSAAIVAVGGSRDVYPCHSSFAAINHTLQTALAWKAHVTLGRVGTSMRHQGLMFVGPHDSIDGAPPRVDPRLTQRELVASAGVWRVYRMTSPGADTRCVGR